MAGSGVISGTYRRSNGTAVSGATVNLLNASDTVVATTTTNASGTYQFTGLRAGSYGVRFPSNSSLKSKAKSNSGTINGEYIRAISVSATSVAAIRRFIRPAPR